MFLGKNDIKLLIEVLEVLRQTGNNKEVAELENLLTKLEKKRVEKNKVNTERIMEKRKTNKLYARSFNEKFSILGI